MLLAEQNGMVLLGGLFAIMVPVTMVLSMLSAVADGKRDPDRGDKSNLF